MRVAVCPKLSLLALVAILSLGCTKPAEPKPSCRLAELRDAVAELDSLEPGAREQLAAGAILDACAQTELPVSRVSDLEFRARRPETVSYPILMPPGEVRRLWLRVCSKQRLRLLDPAQPAQARGSTAYSVCEWKSLDLATLEELEAAEEVGLGTVWAYYPLLRERGVGHELARPLVRALIFAPGVSELDPSF